MGKGSSRFSAGPGTRQTGGDSEVISNKKLKKSSFVGEMDQTSQSTSTTTSSKRVKHPKKFFDEYDTVNHASVPRKLRSAMKKRHYESVSPSSRNGTCRFQTPSKGCNSKLKVGMDARRSTMSMSITEKLTKDEEEAMAALIAMGGTVPAGNNNTHEINLNNETSEPEASTPQDYGSKTTYDAPTVSKCKDLAQKGVLIEDLNETSTVDVEKDLKDVTDGNRSRKRCASQVYICRLIKELQVIGKSTNSHKEPKQRHCSDSNTNTTPENVTSKMIFQEQRYSHGVEASSRTVAQNHTRVPLMHYSAIGSGQVSVGPYFGSPLYDPSQWSRPLFPKQHMWMNPLMATYKSSSYVGSDVRKMQFGQRYEEKGGLLKLTLQ